MRFLVGWAPVALGLALLSTLVSLQWHRTIRGRNDFAALYAGGKLVGSPDLYSRTANEALIKSTLGVTMESVVYTRPPFYAALLKPFTFLPYVAAYGIFCVLCLSSILWFVIRFSRECESLPLYASFSIPVAAFLPQGQDAPLLLTFTGVSILLTRQKRDFLAGVMLSLCAIKFHLFLLIPLLLIAKKRWRLFAGATIGTGGLLLLGIMAAGTQSLGQYLRILRDPWINFSATMMPNIHGLISSLTRSAAAPPIEAGLAAAVVAAFLWTCRKTENYEFLFALSLLGGLLVSYHSGISDQILLLPVFVLIVNAPIGKALRIAVALSLTPIPYFISLGVNVAIPVMLLGVAGLAALAVTRRRDGLVDAVA